MASNSTFEESGLEGLFEKIVIVEGYKIKARELDILRGRVQHDGWDY